MDKTCGVTASAVPAVYVGPLTGLGDAGRFVGELSDALVGLRAVLDEMLSKALSEGSKTIGLINAATAINIHAQNVTNEIDVTLEQIATATGTGYPYGDTENQFKGVAHG